MNTKHIIILGNPVEGFQIFGPFDDPEDAVRWAENQGADWWLTTLEPIEAE